MAHPHPYGKLPAPTRGRGRPCAITDPAGTDPDGNPVTIGDRILEYIEHGMVPEAAAGAAGVPRRTFYGWLQRGGRLLTEIEKGARQVDDLTPLEQAFHALSHGLDEARDRGQLNYVLTVEQVAAGGIEQTEVRTKTRKVLIPGEDGDQVEATEVETVTTSRRTLPDGKLALEALKARWPETWVPAMRVVHEGEVAVELTLSEKRGALASKLPAIEGKLAARPELGPTEGPVDEEGQVAS